MNPALEKNTKILQVHTKAVKEQDGVFGDLKFLKVAELLSGSKTFSGLFEVAGLINDMSADINKLTGEQKKFTSSINESTFGSEKLRNTYDKSAHNVRFMNEELDKVNKKVNDYQEALSDLNKERDKAIENAKTVVDNIEKELKEKEEKFKDSVFSNFGFPSKELGKEITALQNSLQKEKEQLEAVFSSIEADYAKRRELLDKRHEEDLKAYAKSEVEKNKLTRILSKEGMAQELEMMHQQHETLILHAKENGLDTTAITEFYLKEQERIKNKYAQRTIKGTKDQNQALLDEEKRHNENISNLTKGLLRANFEKIFNQNGENKQILLDGLDSLRNISKEQFDEQAFFQEKSLLQTESFNQRRDELIEKVKQSMADFADATQNSNNAITESSEKTADSFEEKWKKIHETLQENVEMIMTGVNAIFSGINSVLSYELEEANEKLSEITTQYDEVVKKREESSDKIQSLEEEAKNARGGRALVLQEQITQEMEANQQLANQEKALAKEKEKQEKEVAKKEKQMKKVELVQNIVSGISNVALSVTKALAKGPIIGQILAAIQAAQGAIQVGIMISQLAKLENGGLLRGKRHAQGGMRIEGSNIEVEGGEYVVNRESTRKNLRLVRYINSERRELKPADLDSFFARSSRGFEPAFSRMMQNGGQLPIAEPTANIDNETLVQAIQSIRIEPRVAVSDIYRVQDSMVSVDGWAGV